MDREPPPVTVTAPGYGGPPPDVLEGAPVRSGRPRSTAVLAVLALTVLGAAVVGGRSTAPPAPRSTPVAPEATDAAGITATASLAGAPTDEPYAQRLTLTVDLPPLDGEGAAGRMRGDEAALVEVQVRGFTVRPDDAREVLPLGRFGVADRGRSTTVPATAVVADCSIETQARRDIVLTVRTGAGPEGSVRAVAEPDVVRALDRLVSRTCRRPRG